MCESVKARLRDPITFLLLLLCGLIAIGAIIHRGNTEYVGRLDGSPVIFEVIEGKEYISFDREGKHYVACLGEEE